jgi:hypothetical protein
MSDTDMTAGGPPNVPVIVAHTRQGVPYPLVGWPTLSPGFGEGWGTYAVEL